jgi:uncharacterized membrane protein YgcG
MIFSQVIDYQLIILNLKMRLISIFLFVIFVNLGVLAQSPTIPSPTGKAVSDFSNLLTVEQEDSISRKLMTFYDSTSNQIAVVNVPVAWLGNKTLEEYSIELANSWKLGSKKNDNGVLFLIVGTPEDKVGRGLRFEVGYGLEGKLTDLMCKDIQTKYVVPELKNSDFYKAINQGIDAIIEVIRFEYNDKPAEVSKTYTGDDQLVQDPMGLFNIEQKKRIEEALKKLWLVNYARVKSQATTSNSIYSVVNIESSYYDVKESGGFIIEINPAYIGSPYLSTENGKPKMMRLNYPACLNIKHRGLNISSFRMIVSEQEKIEKALQAKQFEEAVLLAIEFIQHKQWSHFYSLIWFFLGKIVFNLLIYWQYSISIKKGFSLKKRFFLEKLAFFFITLLGFLLAFFNFFTFGVFTSEALFNSFTTFWFWVLWFLSMFLSGLIIYQIIIRKNPYAAAQFAWLKSSGGGGSYTYGGSGSSYKSGGSSSYSSSSSSSSYSSSSSSSSYYGGGGSFGGGGASSSW